MAVAASPVPVIAVILILFTPQARSNSVAFLFGWVLGLTVVGGIVLVAGDFASDVEEVVHFLKDGRRHVILLPRPYDLMPPGIAKELVSAGIAGDRPVTVFQRLTLEGEKRWDGNLDECGEITEEFSDLSIMVIFTGAIEGPDSHV